MTDMLRAFLGATLAVVTNERALQLVGSALVLLSTIPANRIVWRYRRVPWRQTSLGRTLHSKSLSIAIVLDLAVVSSVFLLLGFRPLWLEWIRLAAFSWVLVALWRQDRAYAAILTDAAHLNEAGRQPNLDEEPTT